MDPTRSTPYSVLGCIRPLLPLPKPPDIYGHVTALAVQNGSRTEVTSVQSSALPPRFSRWHCVVLGSCRQRNTERHARFGHETWSVGVCESWQSLTKRGPGGNTSCQKQLSTTLASTWDALLCRFPSHEQRHGYQRLGTPVNQDRRAPCLALSGEYRICACK
jgi:hypothetical protein